MNEMRKGNAAGAAQIVDGVEQVVTTRLAAEATANNHATDCHHAVSP